MSTPGNVTVMVNGKPMGAAYKTVGELLWSADGARLSYQASSGTANFQVVDGQRLPGEYHWVKEFQWSPDGKHYAFLAASNAVLSLVVDGEEQPRAGPMSMAPSCSAPIANTCLMARVSRSSTISR
jgi:hypothetical protein